MGVMMNVLVIMDLRIILFRSVISFWTAANEGRRTEPMAVLMLLMMRNGKVSPLL